VLENLDFDDKFMSPLTSLKGSKDCGMMIEDEPSCHSDNLSIDKEYAPARGTTELSSLEASIKDINSDDNTSQSTSYSPEKRSAMKQAGRSRRAAIQYTGERQVTLPGHDRAVRQRTCIKFCPSVRVLPVIPVYELMEEPETLWFQHDEYNRIQTRCYVLASKAMKGETCPGKQLCIRGLEFFLCHDGRDAKIDGWDSVFHEQFIQRRTGNFDDEYMREMYQMSSRQSSQVAHQRGKQDEKEVQKCYRASGRGDGEGCDA
jgi:hypothetical protein